MALLYLGISIIIHFGIPAKDQNKAQLRVLPALFTTIAITCCIGFSEIHTIYKITLFLSLNLALTCYQYLYPHSAPPTHQKPKTHQLQSPPPHPHHRNRSHASHLASRLHHPMATHTRHYRRHLPPPRHKGKQTPHRHCRTLLHHQHILCRKRNIPKPNHHQPHRINPTNHLLRPKIHTTTPNNQKFRLLHQNTAQHRHPHQPHPLDRQLHQPPLVL